MMKLCGDANGFGDEHVGDEHDSNVHGDADDDDDDDDDYDDYDDYDDDNGNDDLENDQ